MFNKKGWLLLLTLGLLFCLIPVQVLAADSGSCGDNLYWQLDANGTLTITGTGEMEDYDQHEDNPDTMTTAPWNKSYSSIKKLVIESGVTSIGKFAFYVADNLEEVVLPDTLVSIADFAFSKCSSLKTITIPASVTSIGGTVFYQCTSMEKMIFLGDAPTLGTTDTLPYENEGFQVVYDSDTSGWDNSIWSNYTLVDTDDVYTATMTISPETIRTGDYLYVQIQADHTFAAADIQLEFDNDCLSYETGTNDLVTANAILHNAQVNIVNGQLHLVDFGETKSYYKLPFVALTDGTTSISLTSAKFSKAKDADTKDLTTAQIISKTLSIEIKHQMQSVTKPDYFDGMDSVEYGEDYIFSVSGNNVYYDYEIDAAIDGEEVPVLIDGNTFTIQNVTGTLVITATRTAKQFEIIFVWEDGSKAADLETISYGEDYTFSLPVKEHYTVYKKSIQYENIAGSVDCTANGSKLTIPGSAIIDNIIVTFDSVQSDAIVTVSGDIGDVNYVGSATPGEAYSFTITKDDKYDYTVLVKINGEEVSLTVSGNTYTISANDVVVGTIEITITKTLKTDTVRVTNYLSLSSANVWQIFVASEKLNDRTYVFDGNFLFWSEKYGGYCTLVIATEAPTVTSQNMTLQAGVGSTIVYDMDVNKSGVVDANDAQIVYNMYNCMYSTFTENVTIEKFLRADANGDGKVSTEDAVAVVHEILKR